MGTIYKRKSSENWYYEEKGLIPKQSLKTKDHKKAIVLKFQLDERANRLRLGLEPMTLQTKITVEDLFVEFSKKVLIGKNSNYRKQLTTMLNKIVEMFGSKLLTSIKYQHLVELKTLLQTTLTRKTVHNYLSANKEMFQYAVNCDYIIKNPFDAIKFPSKKPENPRVGLEKDIINKAIELTKTFNWNGYKSFPKLREMDEIYWNIMLFTGLRRNDAGNLTHQKVYGSLIQEKSISSRKIVLVDKLLKYGDKIYNACPSKKMQDSSLLRYKAIMKTLGFTNTDFHCIGHTHATLLQPHYDRTQIGTIIGKSASIDTYIHQDWDNHKRILEEVFI